MNAPAAAFVLDAAALRLAREDALRDGASALDCDWDISDDMMLSYEGGVFSSCEEASIRIDGVQHYINGVTAYLEYQSMIGAR